MYSIFPLGATQLWVSTFMIHVDVVIENDPIRRYLEEGIYFSVVRKRTHYGLVLNGIKTHESSTVIIGKSPKWLLTVQKSHNGRIQCP